MALLNNRSEKNVQISRHFSGQTFLVANDATTLHVCLRDTVLLSEPRGENQTLKALKMQKNDFQNGLIEKLYRMKTTSNTF